MLLERYLQGRKLERDFPEVEEPRAWTSERIILVGEISRDFLSLNRCRKKIVGPPA